jgi:HEPN domain-containing protein
MNTNELVVGEWVSAAYEDFGSAMVLAKIPYYAPACYHCQQSAEKILKAYIIAKENILTKTHDIDALVNKCEQHSSVPSSALSRATKTQAAESASRKM